jgi:uncharacterized protein with ATP-grasp and redox domains
MLLDDEKFRDMVKNDVAIDKGLLDNEILTHTTKIQRYVTLWFNKGFQLKNKIRERDKLYRELYNYYKFQYEKVLDSFSEIKTYIEGDDKYIELQKQIDEITIDYNFLEKTLENLKDKGYNLKNYIEWQKYLKGDRD